MKYQITQYSIVVPLTRKQWDKLHVRENHNWKEIHDRLESVDATDIDYNGHFGMNLWFKVEKLENVEVVLKKFEEYLKTPLKNIPQYR